MKKFIKVSVVLFVVSFGIFNILKNTNIVQTASAYCLFNPNNGEWVCDNDIEPTLGISHIDCICRYTPEGYPIVAQEVERCDWTSGDCDIKSQLTCSEACIGK